MKLKKLFAVITVTFLLLNNILPIMTYAVENTEQTETQEIGREYEIEDEKTWDKSENEDGSVIAKWTFKDRTLTISGSGKMKDWTGSINEDWHRSTYIHVIENVVIENGITSIGEYAFYDCTGLKQIEIPNSVTSIGHYAFLNCSGLTSIEIPKSITSIEKSAFKECSNLKEIKVDKNNIKYTSINGVLFNKNKTTLIKYPSKKEDTTYNIPSSVTSIEEYAFSGCDSLTNILIPNGVTSIGKCAFSDCSSLTNIEISNSVTSIGEEAFSGCGRLTNIKIPNRVKCIGANTFKECSRLTNIEIPNSVTSIEDSAFLKCSSLNNIEIPSSVTNIGRSTFNGCKCLTNIEIPNSVTSMGSGAFSNCSSLTNINIPNNIKGIEQSTFYGCSSLTNIEIPNSVTSIGDGAFCECRSLINIEIPNSVISIGRCTFQDCNSLKYVTIPKKVKSLGFGIFAGCTSLTNIEIPNSVTSIGDSAFLKCSSLKNLKISNSVTSIGNNAFSNCKSLRPIEIPNSVTSIGNNAFYDGIIICETNSEAHRYAESDKVWYILTDNAESQCGKEYRIKDEETWDVSKNGDGSIIAKWTSKNRTLTISGSGEMKDWSSSLKEDWHNTKYNNIIEKVIIENGILNIGNDAFCNCSSLTNIEILNSVTSIGNYAFQDCSSLTNIEIPNSITSIESSALSGCNSLKEIKVEESNSQYTSLEGVLYNKEKATIIKYPSNKEDTAYNIPSSVTSIGNYAFKDCVSLTNIEIPNSVTSIGISAFSRCSSLTDIEIPNSVTSIGNYAFKDCVSLTNIEIPNNVTSIGNYEFEGCSSLINIKIPNSVTSIERYAFKDCSSLTNIEIPNNVTSIGDFAFEDCSSLTKIQIPNGVTSINQYTFKGCRSLNNIEIPNSVTRIGLFAFANCNSLTSINIPNSVTSIGSSAFSGCSSLTSIEIPNSVISIGGSAFEDCSSLTNIEIPNNVTSIEHHTFDGCSSLINIKLPDCVTNIGIFAFYGCSSLTNIEIPNSVTSIEDRAFKECSSLTNIEIPNNVTSIGLSAFELCTNLSSINIPNSVKSIGEYAFNRCSSLTNIEIPSSVTSIEKSSFYNCSSLTEIKVDPENPKYSSIDGILYNKEKTELIESPDKNNVNHIVSNKVTSIENFAFSEYDRVIIICKQNSMMHELAESKKIPYILDEEPPEVKFTPSNFNKPMKEVSIKVDVTDNIAGVDESSLKYLWTTNEEVSKDEITASFANGEEITSPKGVTGIYYLYIYAEDKLENEQITKSNAIILDNTPPEIEVNYSEKNWTNQDVVVTLTANEEVQNIESWNLGSDEKTLTKTYAENTEETVVVKDIAGNETVKTIKIANIDKVKPQITEITEGKIYFSKVKPIAEDEHLKTVELTKDGNKVKIYTNGSEISGIGKYKITATDEAGNVAEAEFEIEKIPDGEDGINYEINPNTLTNQDVEVNLSKKDETKYEDLTIQISTDGENYEEGNSKTLEQNGKLYARYSIDELVGVPLEIDVVNIDKQAPRVTGVQNGRSYSRKATPNVEDENLESIKLFKKEKRQNEETEEEEIIETEVEGYENGNEITELGDYKVIATDKAGNTTIVEFSIKEIPYTKDVVEITKTPEELTNQNVIVTVAKREDEEYKNIKVEISTDEENYEEQEEAFTKTFTENGTIYVRVVEDGVIGEVVEVKVENIDKEKPTLTTEYSTTELTNQNVIVTITASEKVQEIEGWTLSNDELKLTKEYTQNTDINGEEIKVKDIAGNETITKVTVTNIDKENPTAKVSYSTKQPTNQNVVVTITANEKVQAVEGWTLSNDGLTLTKEYTANTNTTGEDVILKDLAGNETKGTIKVENIDKEKPVLNVAYSSQAPTNQNVVVTITANEKVQEIEGWTLSNDGLKLIKTYTANTATNGEEIVVKDLAGNEVITKVTVTNIDKEKPVLNVVYSSQAPTNQNVVVTITSNKKVENIEGWTLSNDSMKLTKEYTQNTATNGEEIKVKDLVGNETITKVTITNIDKENPTARVVYSTKELTNQNVVVTITANEKVQAVEGWTLSNDGLTLTKIYTQNTTEEVILKDLAGNEAKTTVKVENIDKEKPVANVTYSTKEPTNQNVLVTITANEKVQAVEGWTISNDGLKLTKEYTQNTTTNGEEIVVKDLAGNETKTTITIKNIDKVAPQVTGVQNGRSYSRKATPKVEDENLESVQLIKKEENGERAVENYKNGDEITEFGEYKLIATDKAGNTTTVEFSIKDIPNTKDVVEITKTQEDPTNQDVTVTIRKKQDEEYKNLKVEISTDNKNYEEQTSNPTTITLTENGTVYVRVVEDGMVGEVIDVKVENIDKEKPTLTTEYSNTELTNQNVLVTITASEKVQAVEGWTLSNDGLTLTKIYTQNTQDAGEEVTIKDLVGNETKTTVKVENIDKEKPVTNLAYSSQAPTNQNVVVTIKASEKVQQIEGWTLSNDGLNLTKTYKTNTAANGEEIKVKDLAGNEVITKVTVTNIDKEKPTLETTYSTKEPTAENVVVTIKANEKIQNISGWTLSNDGLTLTKIYTQNTQDTGEEVTIKDLVGNETKTKVTVTNIDKVSPVITGVAQDQKYFRNVTPKAQDKNLKTTELIKDGVKVATYTNGKEIKEAGDYQIIATDSVGNTTIVNFSIYDIETTNYKEETINNVNYLKKINVGTKTSEIEELLKNVENFKITRNGTEIYSNKNKAKDQKLATGDKLEFEGKEYTIIVTGDINKDGETDIIDLARCMKVVLGKKQLKTLESLAADTNNDGNVDIIDLAKIRKLSLK